MDYKTTALNEVITIDEIVTVHYFEFLKDYRFPGESHDFWELVYVDKGKIFAQAGDAVCPLEQGDIIFHKPNEWHTLFANGQTAPNIVIVAFCCNSKAMSFFEGKLLKIGDSEKNWMATILRESKTAFSSKLNDPFLSRLEKRGNSPFGCEQIIKLSLEWMLIEMIRRHTENIFITRPEKLSTTVRETSEQDILNKILTYLHEHVRGKISLDDVCAYTMFSRSYVQRLFKKRMGTSIMDYYKKLKIEEAKLMIRDGVYNFTQISECLSYASIHHFSRHFKEITGMNPSEYASSVKIKFD